MQEQDVIQAKIMGREIISVYMDQFATGISVLASDIQEGFHCFLLTVRKLQETSVRIDPLVNINAFKLTEIIRKLIVEQLLSEIGQIKGVTVIVDQK